MQVCNHPALFANVVVTFFQVCNHPELFERREARSPFVMDIGPHLIPKLVFHQKIHSCANSNKNHLLFNKLCIYNSLNVHQSLNPPSTSTGKLIALFSLTVGTSDSFIFTNSGDLNYRRPFIRVTSLVKGKIKWLVRTFKFRISGWILRHFWTKWLPNIWIRNLYSGHNLNTELPITWSTAIGSPLHCSGFFQWN